MGKFGIEKTPYDLLQELAAKSKVLRKSAGYSQSEMAHRSGVSLGSIKRFESTGQISLESLLKLTHVLNRLSDFDQILNPSANLQHIENLFSDRTRK